MDEKVFNVNHVVFDQTSSTQEEAFRSIAKLTSELDFVTSAETFYKDLVAREKTSTTGFKDGIAIPHGKSDEVKESGVFVVKYSNLIEWNSLDDKPVEVAIALTIPEDGATDHLKILSKISRKLLDTEFVSNLKNSSTKEEIAKIINEVE